MPAVPNVPGVPALASYAANTITLVFSDTLAALGIITQSEWGIFLDGVPAIDFNSVLSFSYKQDWSVSDYPVEDGGFQSYDKVQLPFDSRLRIVSRGTDAARQRLLNEIDVIANSLSLYEIVTPEKTYPSVNVTHYDYTRTALNGVGVIVIDVWFVEVRVTSTSTFSNTQNPTNAGQISSGNVQAQTPDDSVSKSFSNGDWTFN